MPARGSSTHGVDPTCRPRSTPTHSSRNLSEAGWVRLRGRERHGWRDRGYMDVLAPSPAAGPTPPSHGWPAFASAVAVALASAGAGRSPAALPSSKM
ncbi:hypothetical protein G6F65_011994 [Rhizopus arrhizus]|nr:hypothetical protein G6F65_011994 [Rhizopus arrhizus]